MPAFLTSACEITSSLGKVHVGHVEGVFGWDM